VKSKFLSLLGLVVSVVYLLNPTAGVWELIPDNIPFLGNIDEAFFAWLLIDSIKKVFVKKSK